MQRADARNACERLPLSRRNTDGKQHGAENGAKDFDVSAVVCCLELDAYIHLITRSALARTFGGIIFVSSNRSTANAPFNRCAPFKPLSEVAAVLSVRKPRWG